MFLKEQEDCLFLLLITLLLLFLIIQLTILTIESKETVTRYFLPRVNTTNYNVLIDGRNFLDQPINDLIKQYDEIRKTATGQGEDYTKECLLNYQYLKCHYNLIAADLSKQKKLDADSRAIQQIEFYGKLKRKSQVYKV